jgi:chemotaxis signal transduction protein
MNHQAQEASLLEQLRAEFDRDFAKRVHVEAGDIVEFLGFSAGDGRYSVLLSEVAAVHEIRTVTRIPGRRPGFEGLVAVQDQLIAVYDLAVLIAAPNIATSRRWLLVSREERQVGFAVDAVDGYQRIPRSRVVQTPERESRTVVIRQAIDEGQSSRLVVGFSALVAGIRMDIDRQGRIAP